MDLRQRTTIATDPFATIKGIGSLTLRAEQYADLDAFAADMQTIWQNCYTFNQDPQADVRSTPLGWKQREGVGPHAVFVVRFNQAQGAATNARNAARLLDRGVQERQVGGPGHLHVR